MEAVFQSIPSAVSCGIITPQFGANLFIHFLVTVLYVMQFVSSQDVHGP